MKFFIFFSIIVLVNSVDVDELKKSYEKGEINLDDFIYELGPGTKNIEDWIFTKALDEFSFDGNKVKKTDFFNNLDKIIELNQKYSNLTFGISRLTFMNFDEFRKSALMIPVSMTDYDKSKMKVYNNSSNKDSINLVEDGILGPVKDQGLCASSWAFSAVATIEALNYKLTNESTSYSEQYVLDCNPDWADCSLGQLDSAYELISTSKNLPLDSDYPYESKKNFRCEKNVKESNFDLSGYFVAGPGDIASRINLLNDGIAVGFLMYFDVTLFHYKNKILEENSNCTNIGKKVNHAVTAVGYGNENGTDFWLLRNSFGPTWGNGGYFKVKRGINWCNIERYGYYPIF